MKILRKVLKCINGSKSISHSEKQILSKSESIFNSAQNCTTRPNCIPVSLEKIEELNSRGLVPMEYTAQDVISIGCRKVFTPIKNVCTKIGKVFTPMKNICTKTGKSLVTATKGVFGAGKYMFARKFGTLDIKPPVRVPETEVIDSVKNALFNL